ncbi:hypothetical protein BH24ACT9_BH24ACT9_01840 [soil metagenome]
MWRKWLVPTEPPDTSTETMLRPGSRRLAHSRHMRSTNRVRAALRAGQGALHRAVFSTSRIQDTLVAHRDLVDRYRSAGIEAPDLTAYEFRVFSQNGEDGVIAELVRRCGVGGEFFVEFGVGNGSECNTAFLAHTMGWSGVYFEPDSQSYEMLEFRYRNHPMVVALPDAITAENVEEKLAAAGVPAEPDILSIDIDGNDYWVWKAIEGYRPRIVIIEYNSALDTAVSRVQPYADSQGWDHSSGYSASLAALERLAESKGYQLVHTESTGANAFFVREDLADRFPGRVPRRSANFAFTGAGWHPAPRRPPDWLAP